MEENIQEKDKKGTKWYNRLLLVDPKIQYLIIFYAVSLGAIMFAMGALFALLLQRVTVLQSEGLTSIGRVDIIMACLLMVIFWVWIYMGLIISNKVVGPVFRIIGELEKIKGGQKLMKIAFRKKDFFSDLTYAYNDVIDQLNKNRAIEEEKK